MTTTRLLLCQMSSSLGFGQVGFRHVGNGGALLVGTMMTLVLIFLALQCKNHVTRLGSS